MFSGENGSIGLKISNMPPKKQPRKEPAPATDSSSPSSQSSDDSSVADVRAAEVQRGRGRGGRGRGAAQVFRTTKEHVVNVLSRISLTPVPPSPGPVQAASMGKQELSIIPERMTVIEKQDFVNHRRIPRNMMSFDRLLLCNTCVANGRNLGKCYLSTTSHR